MISVPSHQQPSNGNRSRIIRIFILLCLVFSIQSCGFIQDLFQGKTKVDRTERPPEKEKVEIRRIEWKDVTDLEEVIRNYPEETKDEHIYDVLCLLPFSGSNQEKGKALYSGIKMAAEKSNPAVNIRITTFDITRLKEQKEMLRKILSVQGFDLIISPYSTDDVNQVIELTRGSGAVVLSPWNTSTSVNRFSKYIQLNPGLESHFSEMVDWTAREYGIDKTLIVGHKKDAQLVEMLQDQNTNLENYFISSNSTESIAYLGQLIASKNVQAIILPIWRASDESYFLSVLSAINAARGARQISVFALSSWMNNENINYNQFNGLNLHFTSSRFVNSESLAIQRFDDRYIDQYKYFASDDAYYGHDVYWMIIDWFSQYENKIADQVINYKCRDCFFRYDFVDKVSERGQPYITNEHVDIISFRDFQYHRVN